MYEVGIFTNGRGWQNWKINDYETAREAYSKACDLCRQFWQSFAQREIKKSPSKNIKKS